MQTTPVTTADLRSSVIAVPPLARIGGRISREENRKAIAHIEAGGIRSLLYGGNANFYHISLADYRDALSVVSEEAGSGTIVTPAIGPAFGTAWDQIQVLRDFDFPTVMLLPMQGLTTDEGVATGFRRLVEALGKPIVLYIKFEGFIEPGTVARLVDDGLVSWIKYAIVREDPAEDAYLASLVDQVDSDRIVSGIGEQPAIVHRRQFGLGGFTSGCVCVQPALSQALLEAMNGEDWDRAEQIRAQFEPLEDLRNEINPVRVLHEAVALAGIAETGEAVPFLSGVDEADRERIGKAARELRAL